MVHCNQFIKFLLFFVLKCCLALAVSFWFNFLFQNQNSLPSLKVTHPSTEENTDADHSFNAVTNHLPVSNHVTAETTPRGHVPKSDTLFSKDQSPGQRHVAFNAGKNML